MYGALAPVPCNGPAQTSQVAAATGTKIMSGVQGFSATDCWEDNTGAQPVFGGSTMWIGVVVRLLEVPPASNRAFCGNFDAAGWVMQYTSSSEIRFLITDGGLRIVDRSITGATVGKCYSLAVTVAASAIKVFVNGVQSGTTFTTMGTYVPGGPNKFAVGARAASGALGDSATIVGVAGSSSVTPADSDILAWHAANMAAADVTQIAGKTEEIWKASALAPSLPAVWTGELAATTLDKQGTGGTFVRFVPSWG